MMKNNETLPDIEKLGHDEFNLDSEEQQRLQQEGEQHVQQVGFISGVKTSGVLWTEPCNPEAIWVTGPYFG